MTRMYLNNVVEWKKLTSEKIKQQKHEKYCYHLEKCLNVF